MARTKRNAHIVYCLQVKNLKYIGVTAQTTDVADDSVIKRVNILKQPHNDSHNWPLDQAIEKYGFEAFTYKILAVVNDKAAALAKKLELIKSEKPKLNSIGVVSRVQSIEDEAPPARAARKGVKSVKAVRGVRRAAEA